MISATVAMELQLSVSLPSTGKLASVVALPQLLRVTAAAAGSLEWAGFSNDFVGHQLVGRLGLNC